MSEADGSGVARRDRRDRAWWEQAIARMEASGMGLGEFAQQEDIGFTTLRRWRARLKRRRGGEQVSGGKSSAKFLTLPLTSRAATGLAEAQAAVEVRLEAGLTMRLYGPAGARLIEALVARIDAGRG